MSDIINISLESAKNRDLFFSQQVDQESILKLTEKIIEINNHDEYLIKLYLIHDLQYIPKPIKIYIDSYGGKVYQCFGLLSIIKNSKTPIHTIVTGCAMSCGFMILICGHRRFAHKLSTPLYHQVSSKVSGKLKDIEIDFIEAKRLQKIIEDLTLEYTKITKEKLKQIYETKTDWYMSSSQALKLGVVDEILN